MTRNIILTLVCAIRFAHDANAEILARISVVPTDLGGTLITSIAPDEDFRLQSTVQDMRDPPPQDGSGTFAAYLDAAYNANLMSIAPDAVLQYNPFFSITRTGDVSTPGVVAGAGASTVSLTAPGNSPQPLWNVLATADSPGVVSFTPSFDLAAGHGVVLYLRNDPILESEIEFVGASLLIVPEPSGLVLATVGLLALFIRTAHRRRTRRAG